MDLDGVCLDGESLCRKVDEGGESAAVSILGCFYKEIIESEWGASVLLKCLSCVEDLSVLDGDVVERLSSAVLDLLDGVEPSWDSGRLGLLFDSLRCLVRHYSVENGAFAKELVTRVSLLMHSYDEWGELELEIVRLFHACIGIVNTHVGDLMIGYLMELCFDEEEAVSCLAWYVLGCYGSDEKVGSRVLAIVRRHNRGNRVLDKIIMSLRGAVESVNREHVGAILSFLVAITKLSDGKENKYLAESHEFRAAIQMLMSETVFYLPISLIFSQIAAKCQDMLVEPELASIAVQIMDLDCNELKTTEKYAIATFFAYLIVHNHMDAFLTYFRSFNYSDMLALWESVVPVLDDDITARVLTEAQECLKQHSLV